MGLERGEPGIERQRIDSVEEIVMREKKRRRRRMVVVVMVEREV